MSIIKNGMINVPERKIRITLLAMEDGDFVLNLLDNAVVFNPFLQKMNKVDLNEDFDIDGISMMIIKKNQKSLCIADVTFLIHLWYGYKNNRKGRNGCENFVKDKGGSSSIVFCNCLISWNSNHKL